MCGASFDHLVGKRQQRRWNFEAERLGGLEVDHELELIWSLYRKVARLLALEDAIDVARGQPIMFSNVIPIGGQSAHGDVVSVWVKGRQAMQGCQLRNQFAMDGRGDVRSHQKTTIRLAGQQADSAFNVGGAFN